MKIYRPSHMYEVQRIATCARSGLRAAKGSIMNLEVLSQIKETNLECAERLKNEFRVYKVDTSYTHLLTRAPFGIG